MYGRTKAPLDKKLKNIRILGNYNEASKNNTYTMEGLFIGMPDSITVELSWVQKPIIPTRKIRISFVNWKGQVVFSDTTVVQKKVRVCHFCESFSHKCFN